MRINEFAMILLNLLNMNTALCMIVEVNWYIITTILRLKSIASYVEMQIYLYH